MRKLFWILLLANVIFFAVMHGNWSGLGDQEVQAQPALNSEMIRLITPSRSQPTVSLPSARATAMSPPASAPVAVLPPAAPVAAPAKAASKTDHPADAAATAKANPGSTACMEWGEFSGPDLARATAALSAMQLGGKLSQRQVELDRGYWVYFPPLKNKAAVNRKIAELKALGINDYFVVQGPGHWQNAISLGVFKTRDAAQKYLRGLNGRGVHTAQVGERAGKLKATIFRLDRVDAGTVTKMTDLQKEFDGSQLNFVPCALTR